MIKKVDDFLEMYQSLTDPKKLEENRRKHEIEQQKVAKRADTGL